MDKDCDNIQSLEDEILELEEKRANPFELLLEVARKVIEDLQGETDAGDLQWNDERPYSEIVLFSVIDKSDRMVISKLETGKFRLEVTVVDDPNQIAGVFLNSPILDPLLGAIEKQLANKK